MKIGVIIIFHNNQDEIDTNEIVQSLKFTEDIELCFVDNESKDKTLEQLREIKESCKNVSIVEIKKHITQNAAKRAGARYVFNNFNLKHIGYIDVNVLKANHYDFNQVLKLLIHHKDLLIEYNKDIRRQQEVKQTLFKSVFPILEFLRVKNIDKIATAINLIIV
jgi:predicted glycosyltransferase involved in capsule biosynthesis